MSRAQQEKMKLKTKEQAFTLSIVEAVSGTSIQLPGLFPILENVEC
jgi:hypothetical protein